jgi:hypothetical protein
MEYVNASTQIVTGNVAINMKSVTTAVVVVHPA